MHHIGVNVRVSAVVDGPLSACTLHSLDQVPLILNAVLEHFDCQSLDDAVVVAVRFLGQANSLRSSCCSLSGWFRGCIYGWIGGTWCRGPRNDVPGSPERRAGVPRHQMPGSTSSNVTSTPARGAGVATFTPARDAGVIHYDPVSIRASMAFRRIDHQDPLSFETSQRAAHSPHTQPRLTCQGRQGRPCFPSFVVAPIGDRQQDHVVGGIRSRSVVEDPSHDADAHLDDTSRSTEAGALVSSHARRERSAFGLQSGQSLKSRSISWRQAVRSRRCERRRFSRTLGRCEGFTACPRAALRHQTTSRARHHEPTVGGQEAATDQEAGGRVPIVRSCFANNAAPARARARRAPTADRRYSDGLTAARLFQFHPYRISLRHGTQLGEC
jgi:hypothetical protein